MALRTAAFTLVWLLSLVALAWPMPEGPAPMVWQLAAGPAYVAGGLMGHWALGWIPFAAVDLGRFALRRGPALGGRSRSRRQG